MCLAGRDLVGGRSTLNQRDVMLLGLGPSGEGVRGEWARGKGEEGGDLHMPPAPTLRSPLRLNDPVTPS